MADLPADEAVVAGLRAATPHDRARLHAAVRAVREASPPLVTWRGGEPDAEGVLQLPWPEYHPAVDELVTALYHAGAVVDWMNWRGTLRDQDASAVQHASVADAVRLITGLVRGERFVDGTLAAALEDGRLVAAAQRLLDG